MIFFPFFGAPCCETLIPWLRPVAFEEIRPLRIASTPTRASLLICVGNISHKQAPLLNNIACDMPQPSSVLYIRGCGKHLSAYASIPSLASYFSIDVQIDTCVIDAARIEQALVQLRSR